MLVEPWIGPNDKLILVHVVPAGPAHVLEGFIATPMLQAGFIHMVDHLESMA